MQQYLALPSGHMQFLIHALDGVPGQFQPPNLLPVELTQAIQAAQAAVVDEPKPETLSFVIRERASPSYGAKPSEPALTLPVSALLPTETPSPAARLFSSVRQILLQELAEARTEGEVVELLGVSKAQAKAWLLQLVKEGALEKLSKPLRF